MSRALAIALAAALGASFASPPAPTRWATDTAGALRGPTRAALDARLEAYERQTGHQVILWIGQSTGDVPLEEWSARTFERWKLGNQKLDDGVAIFFFMKDRRVRLEVGYGLEPVLPDAVAARIINQRALPRLAANDVDGAATATVDGVLAALSAAGEGQTVGPQNISPKPAQLVLMAIVGALFLALLITHPRLAMFLLFNLMSGGRRGGGGLPGGFGGKGGRSGGGGASGTW